MLLKLSEPVTYSDAVSPICLPGLGQEFLGDTRAYAAGWGATRGRPDSKHIIIAHISKYKVNNVATVCLNTHM